MLLLCRVCRTTGVFFRVFVGRPHFLGLACSAFVRSRQFAFSPFERFCLRCRLDLRVLHGCMDGYRHSKVTTPATVVIGGMRQHGQHAQWARLRAGAAPNEAAPDRLSKIHQAIADHPALPPTRPTSPPPRYHLLAASLAYPLGLPGLCSLVCSAFCAVAPRHSRHGSLWSRVPSATPQKRSSVPSTASCRTRAQFSHRNVIKLRPQWRPPPASFSVDCKLACLGYPIRTQGLRG